MRTLSLGLLICACGTAAAQMTVNDAISRALIIDPTIAKIRADVSEAQGFATEVRADLQPQLSIEGRVGAANREREFDGGQTLLSRRASITGQQLIWDSGFSWYRLKDAKERIKAKEELVKAQRETTALGTIAAYLDVLRARRQIGYARQSVDAHTKVLDLAKKRAEAAGNQADIELSTARYKLAENLVAERELALRQAEADFVRYVGMKPPADLVPPKTPDISSLNDIDPKQNFHYFATLKQHEAALLEKKALERKYGPRFFLEATAGLGQDVLGEKGRDNDASVLVVGSWEIFDGGRRKGQIQQAAADIERQLAIIEETLVLLNQDIQSRWADYRTIDQRIGLLRGYAGALEKTVDLYNQQFNLGTRPLLSLLDIQNEVISASIRIADAEHDHTLLGYRLLFFGGRLIRETVGDRYLYDQPGARPSKQDPKHVVPPGRASTDTVHPVLAAIPVAEPVTPKPDLTRLFRTTQDLRSVASK